MCIDIQTQQQISKQLQALKHGKVFMEVKTPNPGKKLSRACSVNHL